MAIVTIQFETPSIFDDADIAEVKAEFSDFIENIDDEVNVKSIVITSMSEAQAEAKKMDEFETMLNEAEIVATLALTPKGANSPTVEIELSSEGNDDE